MKQYEMVWKSKNKKYYERTRDTETKEVKIKQIFPEFELYEESRNETAYKFILDESINLTKKSFNKEKEYREYLGVLDSVGKKAYGTQQPVYSYIRDNYFENGITLTPRIWHFDIEAVPPRGVGFPDPQEALYPVTSFQIYDTYIKKNILIISKPLNDEKSFMERNPDTIVKLCVDEKQMFETFTKLMDYMKPSIIAAWNGENFDIPYVTNRAKNIQGFNYRKLSPINVIAEREVNGVMLFEWEGITLVDTLLAYKDFTYVTQTSYSLDNIANAELGIGSGKVDYGEYKDIIEFHEKDYDKFMDYAVQDVQILKKLDEKLNLNQLLIIISTMMGINPDDAFGTVKPWGIYLTNKAFQKNIIMPQNTKHHMDQGIVGGYVAPPQVGLWNWIASIDVNSMYPMQLSAHNMSAESYISYENLPDEVKNVHDKWCKDENEVKFLSSDGLSEDTNEIKDICQKYNLSFGMNAFFKNDEMGIVAEVVNEIYSNRKISKGKMLTFKAFRTKLKDSLDINC